MAFWISRRGVGNVMKKKGIWKGQHYWGALHKAKGFPDSQTQD